jgi:hypothetical protein
MVEEVTEDATESGTVKARHGRKEIPARRTALTAEPIAPTGAALKKEAAKTSGRIVWRSSSVPGGSLQR